MTGRDDVKPRNSYGLEPSHLVAFGRPACAQYAELHPLVTAKTNIVDGDGGPNRSANKETRNRPRFLGVKPTPFAV